METTDEDIVKRLRSYRVCAPPEHPVHPAICDEAADEIVRLERLLYPDQVARYPHEHLGRHDTV